MNMDQDSQLGLGAHPDLPQWCVPTYQINAANVALLPNQPFMHTACTTDTAVTVSLEQPPLSSHQES